MVDEGRVVLEKSFPTEKVADSPDSLIEELKKLKDEADIIIGPSGYGVPYVCNEDILDPKLFSSEILLLTSISKLSKRTGDPGFEVYRALYKLTNELWKLGANVCYIPSVKQLESVDPSIKVNRIDLGTADKLGASFLAAYSIINSLKTSENFPDFFVLELGFGYNALIYFKGGSIYGGLGGTSLGPGFLTPGPLDLEIIVSKGKWNRNSVWSGGIENVCMSSSLRDAFYPGRTGRCLFYVQSMLRSIRSGIAYLGGTWKEPIVLSGRWADEEISKELEKILGMPISMIRPSLPGASIAKEAAQGMAMIGDSLLGGRFSSLFKRLSLHKASGTVMDHIYIPNMTQAVKRHIEAYKNSLSKEALGRILIEKD